MLTVLQELEESTQIPLSDKVYDVGSDRSLPLRVLSPTELSNMPTDMSFLVSVMCVGRQRKSILVWDEEEDDFNVDEEEDLKLYKVVERVVSHRDGTKGEIEYFCKWNGLNYEHCTWEAWSTGITTTPHPAPLDSPHDLAPLGPHSHGTRCLAWDCRIQCSHSQSSCHHHRHYHYPQHYEKGALQDACTDAQV